MQPLKQKFPPAYLRYLQAQYGVDHQVDELPAVFHQIAKATFLFEKKLAQFKALTQCLTADVCFKYWIQETERIVRETQEYLAYLLLSSTQNEFVALVRQRFTAFAMQISEIAERIYEGHWAYGQSSEADAQFDDMTEFCRRIWQKENKAWLNLAKAWHMIEADSIVKKL